MTQSMDVDKGDDEQIHPVIRESNDRWPVVVGTVAAVLVTGTFFVLATIVPMDLIRRLVLEWTGEVVTGNPF